MGGRWRRRSADTPSPAGSETERRFGLEAFERRVFHDLADPHAQRQVTRLCSVKMGVDHGDTT